jgi:hypothetical protein
MREGRQGSHAGTAQLRTDAVGPRKTAAMTDASVPRPEPPCAEQGPRHLAVLSQRDLGTTAGSCSPAQREGAGRRSAARVSDRGEGGCQAHKAQDDVRAP